MRLISPLILLLAALSFGDAPPAKPQCSIQPAAGTKMADWLKLVKLDRAKAEELARAAIKNPAGATVADSELEVKNGCLVWSFDIKLKVPRGIWEVQIDAGDGKVLVSEYEPPKKEAREKLKSTESVPKP